MWVLKKYLASSADSKQKKMCLLLCQAAQTSIRHLQFTDGHKTSRWVFFFFFNHNGWVVWCSQVYTQVSHWFCDSGLSMRDLIQVVPFMSLVVAIMYSIPLSSIWERKRRAAISAYVTPPRKNTSVVRFSPCWPARTQGASREHKKRQPKLTRKWKT